MDYLQQARLAECQLGASPYAHPSNDDDYKRPKRLDHKGRWIRRRKRANVHQFNLEDWF